MILSLMIAICAQTFTPLGGIVLGALSLALWWAVVRKC
jgi:hypothetical protein